MRKNNGFWTAPRVEILLKFWRGGKSATEIASYFGVTRNSVIGKLNRLGALGISKQERGRRQSRALVAFYKHHPDACAERSKAKLALWANPEWRAKTLASWSALKERRA